MVLSEQIKNMIHWLPKGRTAPAWSNIPLSEILDNEHDLTAQRANSAVSIKFVLSKEGHAL